MAAFWNKFKKDEKEKKQVDEATSNKRDEKKSDDDKKDKNKESRAPIIPSTPKEDKKEKDSKSEKKKSKKSKVKFVNFKEKAELVNDIIISPVVSEDAMNKEAQSKYVFKVGEKSNKSEISEALEARFKVTVEKVNIVRYKTKAHKFRYRKGQKKGFKKAIVTVKKGDKIELFK